MTPLLRGITCKALGMALVCLMLFPKIVRGNDAVIDRIVIVVGDTVVTQSELYTEARVVLVIREGSIGLQLVGDDMDAALVDSIRDYLVDQLLIEKNLNRLRAQRVADEDVDRSVTEVKRAFDSMVAYHAFLRKFGIQEQTLRRIVRRELRNQRYITKRMRSWRGAHSLGKEKNEQVRAKEALDAWLAQLRRSADIRIIGATGILERL